MNDDQMLLLKLILEELRALREAVSAITQGGTAIPSRNQ